MRCPTCRGSVTDATPQKPFCSERCRLIDLGNWLDGRYRIAGERNVDEVGTSQDHGSNDEQSADE